MLHMTTCLIHCCAHALPEDSDLHAALMLYPLDFLVCYVTPELPVLMDSDELLDLVLQHRDTYLGISFVGLDPQKSDCA